MQTEIKVHCSTYYDCSTLSRGQFNDRTKEHHNVPTSLLPWSDFLTFIIYFMFTLFGYLFLNIKQMSRSYINHHYYYWPKK